MPDKKSDKLMQRSQSPMNLHEWFPDLPLDSNPAWGDASFGAYPRFPLSCGLRLFLNSGYLEATTSSVSCEGFTFISGAPFSLQEQLHCQLAVGSHESGAGPFTLACRARVVRVDSHPQGGFEVVCRFEEYSVEPQKHLANR
jgi:hypothetical protein